MFGVPAVVFYKTSWPTYFIAKQLIGVRHIAMPNLLAARRFILDSSKLTRRRTSPARH